MRGKENGWRLCGQRMAATHCTPQTTCVRKRSASSSVHGCESLCHAHQPRALLGREPNPQRDCALQRTTSIFYVCAAAGRADQTVYDPTYTPFIGIVTVIALDLI